MATTGVVTGYHIPAVLPNWYILPEAIASNTVHQGSVLSKLFRQNTPNNKPYCH